MSALPSWARVGAKVVCINADGFGCNWWGAYPVKGNQYTISGYGPDFDTFMLAEIGGNAEWSCYRFRPLVTLEEDIANHFQVHLDHTTPSDLERV
jgi:hypothetical protein